MIKINNEVINIDDLNDESSNYIRTIFKQLLDKQRLSLKAVVESYNELFPEHQTTPQNISNKLTRDAMKFRDVVELAEAAGYDIKFVSHKDKVSDDEPQMEYRGVRKSYTIAAPDDSLADAIFKGLETIKGVNFPKILVAGERALEASQWIQQYLDDGMSELEEMTVLMTSGQLFNVIAKPADVWLSADGKPNKRWK